VRKIIGICGLISSGKSTISNILCKDHGFAELSFAKLLKDITAVAFDWPRDLLQGDTAVSRQWRDTPDKFWSDELNKNVTPRLVLQLLGTECFRNGFHQDFWTLSVKRIITDNPEINYVISDARFLNEKQLIKSLGGEIWQVTRGPDPLWVASAISDNKFQTTFMKTGYPNVHHSEWAWLDSNDTFDNMISNNGTIADLDVAVNEVINKW
jgi:hypothetical protein